VPKCLCSNRYLCCPYRRSPCWRSSTYFTHNHTTNTYRIWWRRAPTTSRPRKCSRPIPIFFIKLSWLPAAQSFSEGCEFYLFTNWSIIAHVLFSYSNSLLLMLNNRKFIADRVNGAGESTGRMMNLSKFRATSRADLDSRNQDTLHLSTQGTAVASKAPEVRI
jgi:hypothetical protein